jgi:hypothetical protein
LIAGNASNKQGEFSCVYIPFQSLRLFAFVSEEEKFDTLMKYILEIENEALANTDWFDTTPKYVCALLPNFFILYFGQKPPTRDITSDNVKMEFVMLGKGCEAWCTGAEEAITSATKIATVLSNAADVLHYNEVTFVQRYCDNNWMGQKMSISADGPHLPIIQVALEVYPVEAADIKKDFLAQLQSSTAHPNYITLTIQHPGKLGQEAEAKKGVAKLVLLCLRGTVDMTSATVSNIAFALPAQGMNIVMDGPCSDRAVALSDLLRQTFTVVRDHDLHDIRSRKCR